MTAAEIRERLRRRHPASVVRNGHVELGPWTVVEEFLEIDVLAIAAVGHPPPPAKGVGWRVRYPRVGYEVKASRSDLRTELLAPGKRAKSVALCHEFYFAVPTGLLKPEELAFEEPAHFADWSAFQRPPCPRHCYRSRRKGPHELWDAERREHVPCPECGGRGYREKSRVELEAPTLWVPRDVGLVEVDGRGTRLVKRAPANEPTPFEDSELGRLVRWVSARPDPRHEGLVAESRIRAAALRQAERERKAERKRLHEEWAARHRLERELEEQAA
jgi:hypothetical protein